MSLWKIAWRSIQQRALASTLTAVSMALGVMLVVAVLVIYSVVHQSFHRGGEGYDLIVGPSKGSNLELVLSSVFYMGQPLSTMPYSVYQDLDQGKIGSGYVRTVVPICLGDSYEDYRVVGTTPGMFNDLQYGEEQTYRFAQGRNFGENDFFDAVIGATVARKTSLKLGDSFRPTHGVAGAEGEKHRPFKIIGILEPTGTPNDRALFVNIEGFYRIGGHTGHSDAELAAESAKRAADAKPSSAKAAEPNKKDDAKKAAAKPADQEADHDHEHEGPVPDELKRVTALLVCTIDPSQTRTLAAEINRGKDAQAAIPADEIARLFEVIIGNIEIVLLVFAVMIVLVAGIGIMVSIYNSMNDRRHEIAIMRALGARRATVMAVILLESILLSLGGGLLGLALGHGITAAAGPWIAEKVNLPIALLQFRPTELVLIPALLVLASVVGYLPAVAAYKTDVGRSLTANP